VGCGVECCFGICDFIVDDEDVELVVVFGVDLMFWLWVLIDIWVCCVSRLLR